MQQLLITCLLILCMLFVYLAAIGGEFGLKNEQQRVHRHTIDYVRDIDA